MNIINSTNINEIRKQVQKLVKAGKEVVVLADNLEFNRKVLEIPGVNILLGCELHDRRDFLKQRDSGLNEFLCKLAAKNNVKIAVNLPALIRLHGREKAVVLSRILQNIMLCKKTKADMTVFPRKYCKQDVISLFLSLKSSSFMAKKAF
jgi:RNase P/RNase MRP subunit p30